MTLEAIEEGLAKIGEGPEEPGEPESPVVRLIEVKVVKANARFAWRVNAAGRPIMQIWPADNSKVAERVQFPLGMRLRVDPEIVKSDGGGQYWRILDQVKKGGVAVGVDLYVVKDDGRLV